MATAPTFPLVTIGQYFELPDPDGPFDWELHFGELVKVGRPKRSHYNMQMRVFDLLRGKLSPDKWLVGIELPYGLTPGYDCRAADIAVASRQRWDAESSADCMAGSPEIVIQVKSRSNRDKAMEADAVLHITHGASAVWLVKPDQCEVVVITPSARQICGLADTIALPDGASLAVAEIFRA